MKRLISNHILIALLLSFSASFAAFAEDDFPALPATFQRITQMQQVTDGGYYAIGAKSLNGKFYLMRAKKSSGKKLEAAAIAESASLTLTDSYANCIWQIHQAGTEGNYYLASGNEYLYAKSEENTDIDISGEKTKWTFSEAENGNFKIGIPDASRYIGLNDMKTYVCFGKYSPSGTADTIQLSLYKLCQTFAEAQGGATLPEDGKPVALADGNTLFANNSLLAADATPLLLSNGTLAPDPQLLQLSRKGGTAASFPLVNSAGEYLNYDLNFSSTEQSWAISDGFIATTETPRRYLVATALGYKLALLSNEAATAAGAVAIRFLPIGATPSASTDEAGTCTLSGAWSATRLSALDWQGITALDLTSLSLPLHAAAFDNRPTDANIPIYVSATESTLIPQGWPFTICGGQLRSPVMLIDRVSLHLPYPFQTAEGQLTYNRIVATDGMWETLCLPFNATVPNGFEALVLDGYDGTALQFHSTSVIPANLPVIIRRTSHNGTTLELSASAGNVAADLSGNGIFKGSYEPVTVAPSDDGLYLLNAGGDAFVRAAAGSHLSPFRGYLQLDGAQAMRLYLPGTDTSAICTTNTDSMANVLHSIDGRKIKMPPVHGIYIRNKQKIIK